MAIQTDKPKDRWLVITSIVVAVLIYNIAQLYFVKFQFELLPLGISIIIQIIFILIYDEVQRRWFFYMRKKYPNLAQTRKRILISFLGLSFNMLVLLTGFIFFMDYMDYPIKYDPTLKDFILPYALGFLFIFINGGAYEAMYFFSKYGKADKESEELRKINLQTQFDSLKNQVNPHFLFNSLNSLSSLIDENPKLAEEFVDELATVYRYLLQTNEKELTTLSKELDFIKSYFHLLQTRHGEGIRLNIEVPPPYFEHQIPPLTLQLLVENAVKHNMVSSSKPLNIDIKINESNALIVKNNIQKKTTTVQSNKVGLTNISAKYAILSTDKMQVLNDNEHFTVVLPLILPA